MGKIRLRVPVLAAAVLLIGLSACATGPSGSAPGSSDTSAGTTGAPGSGSTGPSSPATAGGASGSSSAATESEGSGGAGGQHSDLTIAIQESPGGSTTHYVLRCDGTSPGAGSTVGDPAAACAALEQFGPAAFAPPTLGSRKCTMQYGSSRVAAVKGTFHGSSVSAMFTQTDGCQIATWNSLAPLFGTKAGEL